MTDRALASETTEPLGDAAEIARLMGLPSWRKMSSLSLIDQIERGLPLQAAERITQVMAPGNPRAKYTLMSRSTWSRLQKRPRQLLTREASERVHGIARVLVEARRLWAGDESAMVRFLNRPHLLLGGRTPLDVARQSTTGADIVVRIIGDARAGVAVRDPARSWHGAPWQTRHSAPARARSGRGRRLSYAGGGARGPPRSPRPAPGPRCPHTAASRPPRRPRPACARPAGRLVAAHRKFGSDASPAALRTRSRGTATWRPPSVT